MPNGEDKLLHFVPKIYDTVAQEWKPLYIPPDATDKVQGDVKLSDELSDLNAAEGMTAATPLAVKNATEDKVSKTSLEEQTINGKIKFTGGIAIEPGINIDIQDNSGESVGGGTFTGEDMTLTIDDLGDALVPATADILGGIKIGPSLTAVDDGTTNVLFATDEEFSEYFKDWTGGGGSGGGGITEIPIATKDVLGGIKEGNNVVVDAETGVLNAKTVSDEEFLAYMGGSAETTLPIASVDSLGCVKIGTGVDIAEDGTISVNQKAYALPIASSTSLGGVKIGNGLTVTSDGTISVRAIDLSSNVDNETIVYEQKNGIGDKKLYIPSNSISSNELKNQSITSEKLSTDILGLLNNKPVGLDINAYTWEELSAIIYDNSVPTEILQYLVGQIRYVTLSGYGTIAFQVIGVRHDDLSDGSGKAGLTFQSVPCITTHNMNSSNSTTNGWAVTSMRSWLNSTIYRAISSDLKPYVKMVKKKYRASFEFSSVSTCDDYLFLASYNEVFGQLDYGIEGTWYQYWSTNNSNAARIKYLNSSAQHWWLRSVYSQTAFMNVGNDGSGYGDSASYTYGVAPCFCI